jgi:aldose 1-epimerase
MRIRKYLPMAITLALVGAAPASAQYTARRNGDLIELQDVKNKMSVTVTPSLGNNTADVKVNGQSVLRSPNGNPFLAPWANRLDEQAFYANGKKYAFDMELGNVTGAIPIHGFLQRTDQWQVVELKQDAKSAWVTSRLDVYKYPMWMKQWLFAHTIEMTYRL